MSAFEWQCWIAYRRRHGFALQESRDLIGRLAWMYADCHRKPESPRAELGDYLTSVRAAAVESDGRGLSWDEIKTMKALR